MQADGIEPRPHLEVAPATRAFGLAGANGSALDAGTVDRIVAEVATSQARVVVFDLRTSGHVHADTVGALVDLCRQLRRRSSQLVVLVEDANLRAALAGAEMTRYFPLVGSEGELAGRLAELSAEPPPGHPAVTPAELDAALAAGVTLDDLIREFEPGRP